MVPDINIRVGPGHGPLLAPYAKPARRHTVRNGRRARTEARTMDFARLVEMQKKFAADRVAQMRADADRARTHCIEALQDGRPDPHAMGTFARLKAEADTYERAAREILDALALAV